MLRRQVSQQLIEAPARCHLNALVAEGSFASDTPEGFLFRALDRKLYLCLCREGVPVAKSRKPINRVLQAWIGATATTNSKFYIYIFVWCSENMSS